MDNDDSQPEGEQRQTLLLDGARWPENHPLSTAEIKLAQQHSVLGINRFIALHGLSQAYRPVFSGLVIPLAAWLLRRQRDHEQPLLVGVSGCQGSGRRLFALALQLILRDAFKARSCVLSLSDFSRGLKDRQQIARSIHPLLIYRDLPGTHDLALLQSTLDGLCSQDCSPIKLPVFDRTRDALLPESQWTRFASGPELILFEGWCLGARAQQDTELQSPLNEMEKNEDDNATWRKFVNQQLLVEYAPVFSRLETQIFLKAPDWQSAYDWHVREILTTEAKASQTASSETQKSVRLSVCPYQRLTEAMLRDMPQHTAIILELNAAKQFAGLALNNGRG